MEVSTNLGEEFVWWMGVVEDRNDPLQVGRCRVRILGSHSESKTSIPTEDLPWAHPIIPLNESSSLQIKEGDYVMGFYLDDKESHAPVIMGIFPGIPKVSASPSSGFNDPRIGGSLSSAPRKPQGLTNKKGGVTITEGTPKRNPALLDEPTFSRLSRNQKISETPIGWKKSSVSVAVPTSGPGTWSEPVSPYATKYPYNRVMETESGHILEFDDTPGAERIHIYHRSGTSDEIHPDGTKVTRINADAFEIVLSDKNVYIKGDLNFTAAGDVNIKAGGSVNIEATKDIQLNATGGITTQAGSTQSHTAGSGMNLTGIPLNLNGPPGTILPPPLPVTGD